MRLGGDSGMACVVCGRTLVRGFDCGGEGVWLSLGDLVW